MLCDTWHFLSCPVTFCFKVLTHILPRWLMSGIIWSSLMTLFATFPLNIASHRIALLLLYIQRHDLSWSVPSPCNAIEVIQVRWRRRCGDRWETKNNKNLIANARQKRGNRWLVVRCSCQTQPLRCVTASTTAWLDWCSEEELTWTWN